MQLMPGRYVIKTWRPLIFRASELIMGFIHLQIL